jgi:hypothetical protein
MIAIVIGTPFLSSPTGSPIRPCQALRLNAVYVSTVGEASPPDCKEYELRFRRAGLPLLIAERFRDRAEDLCLRSGATA